MSRHLERVDRDEPTTPLGKLADQMFALIEDDSTRAIIMLINEESGEAMTATHNYDPEARDAVVDLLMHLQAMAAGSGMKLDFMTMDEHGVNRMEGFEPYEERE